MRDVVLLHGGLYNATCGDRVVAALRSLERQPFGKIVQLDIPGAGTKNKRPIDTLTRDDVVAELCSEVVDAGLESPVLIGHSIAGTLMPLMAQRIEFSALCFVTTAILAPGQIGNDLFGAVKFGEDPGVVGYPADPYTTTPREMDRLRFCLDMPDAEAGAWLDHCYEDVPPPALMSTPASGIDPTSLPPATYVRALRSPVFPLDWQDRFACRIAPDIRVVDIDRGHAPFFTHPNVLAALLVDLYG